MITPQEAEAHEFPKASFGGYNMQQVDLYLENLIDDYRTLYQENQTLKNKLKVLVDKVEEYRATEDAMRMTLHSAQKMAEAMVKEGEEKRQATIKAAVDEAKAKSDEVKAVLQKEEDAVRAELTGVKQELADERVRLAAARRSTVAYVGKLKEMYTHELSYIGNLSELTAADAPLLSDTPIAPLHVQPAPEEPPEDTVPVKEETLGMPSVSVPVQEHEIRQEVAQGVATMAENAAVPDQEDALEDTRVFGQISFGTDQ